MDYATYNLIANQLDWLDAHLQEFNPETNIPEELPAHLRQGAIQACESLVPTLLHCFSEASLFLRLGRPSCEVPAMQERYSELLTQVEGLFEVAANLVPFAANFLPDEIPEDDLEYFNNHVTLGRMWLSECNTLEKFFDQIDSSSDLLRLIVEKASDTFEIPETPKTLTRIVVVRRAQ